MASLCSGVEFRYEKSQGRVMGVEGPLSMSGRQSGKVTRPTNFGSQGHRDATPHARLKDRCRPSRLLTA